MKIKHPYTGKTIKTDGVYPIYDPYYSITICPQCGNVLNKSEDKKDKDCHGHPIYKGEDCDKCLWRNTIEE
jgi:methionyl-tRNA synthetase